MHKNLLIHFGGEYEKKDILVCVQMHDLSISKGRTSEAIEPYGHTRMECGKTAIYFVVSFPRSVIGHGAI